MYEVISQYYDLFMDSRRPWIDFALGKVGSGKRGADVGCGSGEVAMRLALSGNRVIAIDSSPGMLTVAAQKFREAGLDIPTVLQSAQQLNLGGEMDFITAMCDVVNYLKNPRSFFRAAYKNLRYGGVLIFDISNEYKLREVLGNNVYTDTQGGITYVWENFLCRDRVEMELSFFVPEGRLYKKLTDTQTQYIHSDEAILNELALEGFSVKKTAKKDRTYFVAKKVKR
ncbi:MAG: methyltransferase domain-containing protein [Clostridia bacterium]|nr:methyltransferase domain-containing protein [Clostridia bacterium]